MGDWLDLLTGGDHAKMIFQLKQMRSTHCPSDEVKVGDSLGAVSISVLDFMSKTSYVSLLLFPCSVNWRE